MRWLAAVLGWGAVAYLGLALYLYLFQAGYVYFPDLPSRQVESRRPIIHAIRLSLRMEGRLHSLRMQRIS